MERIKSCPCCSRPADVLTHKRLGRSLGLVLFNCLCGSTYSLTEAQLHAAVLLKQESLAKELAARPPTAEQLQSLGLSRGLLARWYAEDQAATEGED